jgi:NADPH-dependent 2,4-dienoyl-CoA reductase/sulfur reductase-like enzyme
LTQPGVQVTVIEAQPHIWARFADPTLAGFVQDYCLQKGVTFLTDELVTEIRGHGRPNAVVTRSGTQIACGFVCIGVGIVPNVELAQQTGLTVDKGVVVNEYLQSSHPDVYAAGDVANYLQRQVRSEERIEEIDADRVLFAASGRGHATPAADREDFPVGIVVPILDATDEPLPNLVVG